MRSLSDDIWNHPETEYVEKYTVEQADFLLKSQGYEVAVPYCGLETAFRCEYGSADGPVFAFCSGYPDAINSPDSVAMEHQGSEIVLHGRSAHADGAPEKRSMHWMCFNFFLPQ